MKNKLFLNLLASVVIGLLFFEICIRLGTIFFPRLLPPITFGGAHPRNLIIADKELGYRLRPNASGAETNDYQEYHIQANINSRGLRDYKHGLSKNTYRILGLGDSYTFGEGVELKDSYLSVLESKLKARFGQNQIEVFKAGVPGYGTKQEVDFLKKYISEFKPNLVLLGLLPDETQRSISPYTYCQGYIVDSKKTDSLYLVSGKLYSSRAKSRFWGRVDAYIKHYYLTPQFMQSRVKNLRSKLKKKIDGDKAPDEDLQDKFKLTFSLLKEYQEICRKNSALAVLVMIQGNTREDAYISSFSESIGIPTLSLVPYFEKLGKNGMRYHFDHDLHWNVVGHKACADALYDFLSSRGLLDVSK